MRRLRLRSAFAPLLAAGALTAWAPACGGAGDAPDPFRAGITPEGATATPPAGTAGSPSPARGHAGEGSPSVEATAEPTETPVPDPPDLRLELRASGFDRPTFVTNAGDGSGRLFVVEKRGAIRVLEATGDLPDLFLDISDRVNSDANERGLLGLAFAPDYEVTGRIFATYTAAAGQMVLSTFGEGEGEPGRPDPNNEKVLLEVPHPRSNHNGGMIAFGPDGYLYLGTGDGGGAGDPDRAGQDLSTLAGKLLRLDVSRAAQGLISAPADNPFVAVDGARPEIWALGLRNPWRFSFDRVTGDLWIGDVGQDRVEEIDFQPAGGRGGENYGWSTVEGGRCFRPALGCRAAGLTPPVYEYEHGPGCSVTGGYVYRGSAVPGLQGAYVFSDYCDPRIYLLTRGQEGAAHVADGGPAPPSISSFGEDEAGELYAVSDGEGAVWRLVRAS